MRRLLPLLAALLGAGCDDHGTYYGDVPFVEGYYEFAEPIFTIRSDFPAIADIDRAGDIYFDFEGELLFYSRPVWFRLTHHGYVQGYRIIGDWRLETDLPTTDRGGFSAQR